MGTEKLSPKVSPLHQKFYEKTYPGHSLPFKLDRTWCQWQRNCNIKELAWLLTCEQNFLFSENLVLQILFLFIKGVWLFRTKFYTLLQKLSFQRSKFQSGMRFSNSPFFPGMETTLLLLSRDSGGSLSHIGATHPCAHTSKLAPKWCNAHHQILHP